MTMTDEEYQQRKAELYAEAMKAKDNPQDNPQAAYFASWLTFFMDEQARWRNEYENVLAAGRWLMTQV